MIGLIAIAVSIVGAAMLRTPNALMPWHELHNPQVGPNQSVYRFSPADGSLWRLVHGRWEKVTDGKE